MFSLLLACRVVSRITQKQWKDLCGNFTRKRAWFKFWTRSWDGWGLRNFFNRLISLINWLPHHLTKSRGHSHSWSLPQSHGGDCIHWQSNMNLVGNIIVLILPSMCTDTWNPRCHSVITGERPNVMPWWRSALSERLLLVYWNLHVIFEEFLQSNKGTENDNRRHIARLRK